MSDGTQPLPNRSLHQKSASHGSGDCPLPFCLSSLIHQAPILFISRSTSISNAAHNQTRTRTRTRRSAWTKGDNGTATISRNPAIRMHPGHSHASRWRLPCPPCLAPPQQSLVQDGSTLPVPKPHGSHRRNLAKTLAILPGPQERTRGTCPGAPTTIFTRQFTIRAFSHSELAFT